MARWLTAESWFGSLSPRFVVSISESETSPPNASLSRTHLKSSPPHPKAETGWEVSEEQSTRSEYGSVRAAKPLIASAAAFRANTISKNKAHSQSSCLLPSLQNFRLVHFHGLDICLMFFWLYYCFFCVLYFCRESGGDVTKFWGQPSGADCEWDKSERASPSICVTECIPLDCSRIPLIFLAFKLFHIIIERLFNKLYWLVCRQGVSFSVSPFFFFCLGCVFLQSVYTSCTRNARLMGWILLEMMMISMSALVGVIMKGTR